MTRHSIVLLALFCFTAAAVGDVVFDDNFEHNPFVGSGNPDGWLVFGSPLLDKGTLHNSENHSPTAAVWAAVSWSSWGWGATTVSNESTRYDVLNDNATMSCWMRSTNAFSASSIALTIFDEDGTQWRTADGDLFQLTTSWTEYDTVLGDMVVEAAGMTPGLDYDNITVVGFLAYTAGQSDDNMVQFDDFTLTSIPEPGTMAALFVGLSLAMVYRMRSRRS